MGLEIFEGDVLVTLGALDVIGWHDVDGSILMLDLEISLAHFLTMEYNIIGIIKKHFFIFIKMRIRIIDHSGFRTFLRRLRTW